MYRGPLDRFSLSVGGKNKNNHIGTAILVHVKLYRQLDCTSSLTHIYWCFLNDGVQYWGNNKN